MEALLRPGQLVPNFTLLDSQGEPLRRTIYRGRKHLVLAFLPAVADEAGRAYLRALADRYADIRAAAGEVLALLPASPDELAELRRDLALPFPLLSDPDGATGARFLPRGAQAGVFIVDRYGELYHGAPVRSSAELTAPDEILVWLNAVDHQCVI